MKKRQYRQTRRAEQQAETRERIVDAAIELHRTLGPAATTISALAERAGVQRLTVYKHFADDREIFQACSSKWMAQNPPPDLERIDGASAEARTESLLLALYRYYGRTQEMWTSVYRDAARLEPVAEALAGFEDYLDGARRYLLAGYETTANRKLAAVIGHVLRFSTWQSLMRERLSAKASARIASGWIRDAAGPRRRSGSGRASAARGAGSR